MNKNFKRRSKTCLGYKKIKKQQGNKSLVKWLVYNDSFNSWVDNKDINKL